MRPTRLPICSLPNLISRPQKLSKISPVPNNPSALTDGFTWSVVPPSMNTRAFVLAILSPLSIGVVVIAHWWMKAHSATDTDSSTDATADAGATASADSERLIVEAFNGPTHTEDAPGGEEAPTIVKCDSISGRDHGDTTTKQPSSFPPSDDVGTDTDSCKSPTAATATVEASAAEHTGLFAIASCQCQGTVSAERSKLDERGAAELTTIPRPEEDKCEPELECDAAASTKTIDGCDASSALQSDAIALAHRLAPHTTSTGQFECEPTLPVAVTSSIQWYRYQALKNRFKAVAIDFVVNSASSRIQVADNNDKGQSANKVNALVGAYKRLARCPSFVVEERAAELEREQHHEPVNAAALRLVRLAIEVPEIAIGTTRTVISTASTRKLEGRLNKANALELFRLTPEQLDGTSFSIFQGIDLSVLNLLELRALLHVFESCKVGSDTAADVGTDAGEWHRRLKSAVSGAKQQFDTHRRRSLHDEGRCCGSLDVTTEQSACAFRRVFDHALPLYAPQVKTAIITKYVDAEVGTH